jgi:hypothetical protein
MLRVWGFHGESTVQVKFIGYLAKSDPFGVFLNHLPNQKTVFLWAYFSW